MLAPARRTALHLVAFALALFGSPGCYTPPHPVSLPACPRGPDGRRLSSGTLRTLPSEIPTLSLDSMRWNVSSGSEEFGHETYLQYQGRIVATQETPLWDLGILFQWTKGSRLVADHVLHTFEFSERDTATLGDYTTVTFLRARPERAAQLWNLRSTYGTRPQSTWGCPTTARLIRLMNVPTEFGLTAAMAADSGARLAAMRAAGRSLAPLTVLVDTVFAFPDELPSRGHAAAPSGDLMNSTVFGGVAVNTTPDTLHDAAVWYAVAGNDTIVYFVGDVPPHALATFGGGPIQPRTNRSDRGTWVNAPEMAGVNGAFSHSIRSYREHNGVPPSTVPEDEIPPPPPPPPRVFDPAHIDMFLLANGADVAIAAHARTSAAGDTVSQLVLVVPTCCDPRAHLMRSVAAAPPAPADTATAAFTYTSDLDIEKRLTAALDELQRRGLTTGSLPNSDGPFALPLPGTEMFVLAFPTTRRGAIVRYPAGAPPQALTDALALLDSLARSRLPGRAP